MLFWPRNRSSRNASAGKACIPASPEPNRRSALLAGAAAMATAARWLWRAKLPVAKAPPGSVEFPVARLIRPKEQGRVCTNDDGGYGSRSQFESEVRWRFPDRDHAGIVLDHDPPGAKPVTAS